MTELEKRLKRLVNSGFNYEELLKQDLLCKVGTINLGQARLALRKMINGMSVSEAIKQVETFRG